MRTDTETRRGLRVHRPNPLTVYLSLFGRSERMVAAEGERDAAKRFGVPRAEVRHFPLWVERNPEAIALALAAPGVVFWRRHGREPWKRYSRAVRYARRWNKRHGLSETKG